MVVGEKYKLKMNRSVLTAALFVLAVPVFCLADTIQVVPELNPASASTAIAVIAGFGMLLRDRFRRR